MNHDHSCFDLLLAGGSGLLGANWCLSRRGQKAIIAINHSHRVALKGVESQCIDLAVHPDSFREVLQKKMPQVIVNTIALTNVDLCQRDPSLANRLNCQIARNVAEAAREAGVKLVHISTDQVFDGKQKQNSELYHETGPTSPVNVYGQTKLHAEKIVSEICPDALIIRTNFYGLGHNYRQSFSDWIYKTLSSGEELSGHDNIYYTPIHVNTLIRSIEELLALKESGLFHVVGSENISKLEFIQKFAKVFALDHHLIKKGHYIDSEVPRPHNMGLSNQKLRQAIGHDLPTLEEDLQELLQQSEQGIADQLRMAIQ